MNRAALLCGHFRMAGGLSCVFFLPSTLLRACSCFWFRRPGLNNRRFEVCLVPSKRRKKAEAQEDEMRVCFLLFADRAKPRHGFPLGVCDVRADRRRQRVPADAGQRARGRQLGRRVARHHARQHHRGEPKVCIQLLFARVHSLSIALCESASVCHITPFFFSLDRCVQLVLSAPRPLATAPRLRPQPASFAVFHADSELFLFAFRAIALAVCAVTTISVYLGTCALRSFFLLFFAQCSLFQKSFCGARVHTRWFSCGA